MILVYVYHILHPMCIKEMHHEGTTVRDAFSLVPIEVALHFALEIDLLGRS